MKKNIAERCVDLFVQVRWRRRVSNRRTDTTPDSPNSFKLGYEFSGNIFGRMPMKHRRLSIITFLSTIIGMSLFSCHNLVNSNNAGLKANAGEDQETIVGSYVILDAGQSTGGN